MSHHDGIWDKQSEKNTTRMGRIFSALNFMRNETAEVIDNKPVRGGKYDFHYIMNCVNPLFFFPSCQFSLASLWNSINMHCKPLILGHFHYSVHITNSVERFLLRTFFSSRSLFCWIWELFNLLSTYIIICWTFIYFL